VVKRPVLHHQDDDMFQLIESRRHRNTPVMNSSALGCGNVSWIW
jgi:hypothetical protein